MDINNISTVFIVKNCARTNGSDTIDGDSVTGVQITAPIEDDLSAAETYFGPGELLVTDASGLNLTAATITSKSLDAIKLVQRSHNGLNFYSSNLIAGKTITSYNLTAYKAASEQTSVIHTIDATLKDTVYMIKIRRVNGQAINNRDKCVRTVSFKTAVAGSTAAQIATGLVADINANLSNDITIPVTAIVDDAAVIITAKALPYSVGVEEYQKLNFIVELVNFTATVEDNIDANLVYNSITYLQATPGAGTYEQIADMEWYAKMYIGVNKQKINVGFRVPEVALDVQKYEDDGTTINRYNTITINWQDTQGNFSMNVNNTGAVIIALPLDNQTSNQQSVIVAALNKYCNTIFGIPAIGSQSSGNATISAGNITLA
jgi:hypothetical protein